MQKITGNSSYNGVANIGTDATIKSSFKFPSSFTTDTLWFVSSLYGGMIFNVEEPGSGIMDSFFLFQYINTEGLSTLSFPPNTNLTFRTEQFQLDRQPTIRGVILIAAGTGTLHIAISGHSFTDIVVNSQSSSTIYRSFGVKTAIQPSLNISSTDFDGYIAKVHLFGTYAEGEPI
jgi:hypothetical protein